MNNPIKLLISGADMGSLIASCATRSKYKGTGAGKSQKNRM